MDITKELFDFLWDCPHQTGKGIAAGSVTDYIFKVKKSDEDKFKQLYTKAARAGIEDLECDTLPLKCVNAKYDPETCELKWESGDYTRQYPGYNFDGFYQSGMSVSIDCEKYLTFSKKLWYYDAFFKRYCCTYSDSPYESYVVCIMKGDN
jgi:hypothetical protein